MPECETEYWEARSVVVTMLDPYNGDDLTDYQRRCLAKVLEWGDRYEDLQH